ncbi:MAG: DUF5005 domain-containing protein [Cyclobacteriaceae bacterium]
MKNNFLVLLVALTLFCCEGDKKDELEVTPFRDRPASYFDSLFISYGNGFTGGDGTYSVELPDGRQLWIFGDTFLGEVASDFTRKKQSPLYIRNSFVVQDGDSIITLHQGEPWEFKSMMIPHEVLSGVRDEHQIWYWPGDAFVRDDTLHVFASKFTQLDTGMWDFKFLETALISYSLPGFQEIAHQVIPKTKDLNIHFGHAVLQEDKTTYIYGYGQGGAYVAKTTNEVADDWQFFTGNGWTDNVEEAVPMTDADGSEQFSIIKTRDKYVYLTQEGELGTRVFTYTSNTPYGPWGNQRLVYNTPIPYDNENLFTYNSLIHPQFANDSTILLSYNTNSFRLEDHFENAGIYRPRFARIPFAEIFDD